MTFNDTLGIVLVYAYIALLFFSAEKLWKGDKSVGRKILHIGVGNIVFILIMFDTWWVEVLIASSFVFFTFLITQRMQLYFLNKLTFKDREGLVFQKVYRKIITRLSLISASDAGNEFGLVYYCMAYTALAFLFFNDPGFIAIGILPLAYGDGLGAIIGKKFGRHKYCIVDKKSIEGSLAVLVATTIAVTFGMVYYGLPFESSLIKAFIVGIVVAIVEAIAPRGLDNLAIPASAVLVYCLILA